MAKKQNDKEALDALSILDDLNPYATFLSENTLSRVDHFIDTGCGALNAIISGDIVNGGVPCGRVTTFSGESSSGKTYILNKILANAQQKSDMFPVIFDSELDKEKNMAMNMGLDPKRTKYVPIGTVEDLTIQCVKFLDNVIEKKLFKKFVIGVDSLGNLASNKEVSDIEKSKTTSDQGIRAKEIKKFFRLITFKCALAGIPIIVNNHIYHDPSQLHPSLVKKTGGGEGPVYMASVGVQFAARKERTEDENLADALPESKTYSGATIRFLTVKNRFVPPFLACENYLSFTKGLDKYSGLIEMAENHKVISKDGHRYVMEDGTKLGFKKDFDSDADIWDNKIIPILNERIKQAYRYHSVSADIEPVDVIEQEEE